MKKEVQQKRPSSSNKFAKDCIVTALLKLIKEKPLASVSITELCNRAGVSRMTFYRNYNSMEDIFFKYLDEIFNDYQNDIYLLDIRINKDPTLNTPDAYCNREYLVCYFNYIYRYKDFLDGLVQCGFDVIFLDKLNGYIFDRWRDFFDCYILAAFAGTLYNMFHLWSSRNYTENPEVFIDTIMKLYCCNAELLNNTNNF